MLRGNRRLFIALGIVGFLTIGIGIATWPTSPSLTNYGEENPSNTDYRPGGKNCEAPVLAAVRDSRERARKTDACRREAEEYRQQTNDLIQQTRAADAAQAQANIASQQLWIGWFQTLGGFLTLAAAVGAAIYARDAAHQTSIANKISEANSKQTFRAYVSVGRVWATVINTPHGILCTANVQFTNHGTTSAEIQKQRALMFIHSTGNFGGGGGYGGGDEKRLLMPTASFTDKRLGRWTDAEAFSTVTKMRVGVAFTAVDSGGHLWPCVTWWVVDTPEGIRVGDEIDFYQTSYTDGPDSELDGLLDI